MSTVVLSFAYSIALLVAGAAFYIFGSAIEGTVFICTGILGFILIMMASHIVNAIRENNKKES